MEFSLDYINKNIKDMEDYGRFVQQLEDTTTDYEIIKKLGFIRSILINDLHRKYLDYKTRIEEKFD